MRIGLTGDTHNNVNNIAKICAIFNQEKVDFVVHTGDITLPKSLKAFSMLDMPLKGVFGNNDQGELKGLNEVCKSYKFDFMSAEVRLEDKNLSLLLFWCSTRFTVKKRQTIGRDV